MTDIETLIFCAFRYSLGRKTYIVGHICDIIARHKDDISAETKSKMVQEINVAISMGQAGMGMDTDEWKKLAEVLK